MRTAIRAWLQAHQFKVLLGGLLTIIVLRAFAEVEQQFGEGAAVVGLALPLFALVSVTETRHRLVIAVVLALAAAASSAGVVSGALSVRESAALELSLVFLAFTTLVVFAGVFRSPRVTGDVLAGAVAGYILLGLVWAGVHALVEAYRPHSYAVATNAAGAPTYNDLVYFSFVTLMSIGYGDVVALGGPARMLVICEGITGVAFNTIVLALLVSKYLVHSGQAPG
jgi:uncharacterized membrane protein